MGEPAVLALYLPQFHPTAENDAWWGPGFTEWTNVVQAQPLFDGHYQPHLPGELGFYDLRLAETRAAQAALAASHGVDAFCYYHYWLDGRRLLHRPFDEVLRTGEPDFPFCLFWANESWARTWYGASSEVLLPQRYSDDDDVAHVEWLITAFRDRRYFRVDGRPLFVVYWASKLPDPVRTFDIWEKRCGEAGLPRPYLITIDTDDDPAEVGCDAALPFFPHGIESLQPPLERVDRDGRLLCRACDYDALVASAVARPDPTWARHACVVPNWDNTPRRLGQGVPLVLHGSTPESYGRWLEAALRREQAHHRPGLVFVNAWNEWAEGAHLEPDRRWGRAYLEATRRAVEAVRGPVPRVDDASGHVGDEPLAAARDRRERDLYDTVVRLQGAASEALATVAREVRRRNAELMHHLAEARHDRDQLAHALDAILVDRGALAIGSETPVARYLELVRDRAVKLGATETALRAAQDAAERAIVSGVPGSLVAVGPGAAAVVVTWWAMLFALGVDDRSAFAADLGVSHGAARRELFELGVDRHAPFVHNLFESSADQVGLAARSEHIAVLWIGGDGVADVDALRARLDPSGIVLEH